MDHAPIGGLDMMSNLFFTAILYCGSFALPHIIGWVGSPIPYVFGYTGMFFLHRYFSGEDIHPAYSKSCFLFAVVALAALLFERHKDSIASWVVGAIAMGIGTMGLVYWLINLNPV